MSASAPDDGVTKKTSLQTGALMVLICGASAL